VPSMNRRQFLVASSVTGGAALAAGATGVTWQHLMSRAAIDPLAAGSRVLVVLSLYGGNDGLNTLIPYSDPAYHAARPDLAYAESDVLRLDSALGLNPALVGLNRLWQAKQLAIVRGVGYPKPDHSHFRSMDIWQTGSPDAPVNTGWIGRWLDATGDDPLRAVNIGAVLPPLAVGARAAAAALPLGRDRTLPAELAAALGSLGQPDPTDSVACSLVTAGYRAERRVTSTFAGVLNPVGAGGESDQQAPASSAGGQGSLKDQLAVVARCIAAGVPTRVYSVSQGGFDTHADEKDAQQSQLGLVDNAVTGFLDALAKTPHGKDVVLLAYSEFGRRVQANASQGTDHGTAGPVFVAGVAGGPVKGGFYGEQPSLTELDDGDLRVSTDFRAVYAELLHKVLDTDPARVLSTQPPAVGLL
jgi:uncharacterized protein (DUF1501 family)